MVIGLTHRGADGRAILPHLRELRKMFAHPHAGHAGGDGGELATVFLAGAVLDVPHVRVARAARQVNHDDALLLLRGASQRFLGAKQLRQCHAAHGQRANLQKITARLPVAKAAIGFALYFNHVRLGLRLKQFRNGTAVLDDVCRAALVIHELHLWAQPKHLQHSGENILRGGEALGGFLELGGGLADDLAHV